jgi:hypothetical protein
MPSNIFQSSLISSRDWMNCAEDGNSDKHEQAYGLLHNDAAAERQGIFTISRRALSNARREDEAIADGDCDHQYD